MKRSTLYPMLFEPVLKDYIWGGRNLIQLGRQLPAGTIAESWEIAGHADGTTRVANGRYQGRLLTTLLDELGLDLIGAHNAWAYERGKFPLLIKLLDANRPLSVQVHPDDDYALLHEGNELGKTEMWVVLRAEPTARIILGVKPGTTPGSFRRALEAGDVANSLHEIAVAAGDVVCVPAGTLHAILGGLIIAEIQQNSNTTYRVFDWNRVQADGSTRPLHVDRALDVINFAQIAPSVTTPHLLEQTAGCRREQLCANRYFVTERIFLEDGASFAGCCDGSTLEIWGVLTGAAQANDVEIVAVRFVLLPAALGDFVVTAVGAATLLRTYVPAPTTS